MPYIVQRVRNGDGKVLYQRQRSTTGQVVALPYVAAMNDMLNATIARGTGKRAALPGQFAAGKTGTTQNSRDAWFVGYTARYIAGVWIGNDDGSRMRKVTGGTFPALLWHDIMTYAHKDKPPLPLPGTRSPALEGVMARLPWQSPQATSDETAGEPLYRRVFGIFGGNG